MSSLSLSGLVCSRQHCGIDAFAKGKGSKVGEGFYVGAALDQVKDGKVRKEFFFWLV